MKPAATERSRMEMVAGNVPVPAESARVFPNFHFLADRITEIGAALIQLVHADDLAGDAGCSRWDFAVEMAELLKMGVARTELRWLEGRGFVLHRQETAAARGRRRFVAAALGAMNARSCFVVTETGRRLAADWSLLPIPLQQASAVAAAPLHPRGDGSPGPLVERLRPNFDVDRQILLFNGRVVKRFCRTAPSQRLILLAFQEVGWRVRIDDPLPPRPGVCSKRRLHDAIKGLNRRHFFSAIRFSSDGSGEGVRWQPLA